MLALGCIPGGCLIGIRIQRQPFKSKLVNRSVVMQKEDTKPNLSSTFLVDEILKLTKQVCAVPTRVHSVLFLMVDQQNSFCIPKDDRHNLPSSFFLINLGEPGCFQ